MRKTFLIISLGMSVAYADSEERSWTEKAMDKGREIKYSVEAYFDDIAMSVHDHYIGLIEGAEILGRDIAYYGSVATFEIKDHGSGFVYGADYWFQAGKAKSDVYNQRYQNALEENPYYQYGYTSGYRDGKKNWVNRLTAAINIREVFYVIGDHVDGLTDGKAYWYQIGFEKGQESNANTPVRDKGYDDGFNDAKKGIDQKYNVFW